MDNCCENAVPAPACPPEKPKILYAAKEPYPALKLDCRNTAYALEMLDNVGGSNSEMSAVASYFYNHLMTAEYQEVADVFHHISVVEMHHLDIFGELALMHGAEPRLWTRRKNQMIYWTPSYIKYALSIKVILTEAIRGERATVEKYERQLTLIDDPCICAVLRRIILDEEIHIRIFSDLYERYGACLAN